MKNTIRFFVLSLLLGVSPALAQTLVHYWNFNTVTGVSGPVNPSTLPAIKADFTLGDTSTVKMYYKVLPGTSSSYSTYYDVNTGCDVNDRIGATAGNSLRLRNPSDSMQLVMNIPSVGFKDPVVSYVVQRSSAGNGALTNSFSYSVDGGATWKTSGLSITSAATDPNWSTTPISIRINDPLANNNSGLMFRILFTGGQNTGTSGNNRIDNVAVDGTPVPTSPVVNIIYTSDQHYGITRPRLYQQSNVNGQTVNRALIRKMNALPTLTAPSDGGILAGATVGEIRYLVETGDIANRMESGCQADSVSWRQFWGDFNDSLTLQTNWGLKPEMFLSPGNHDISNAIGYTTPLVPLTDATSMFQMYNLMVKPAVARTITSYNYATDKVNYSRDIKGIHCMFVNFWPDSANRIWMETDLASVNPQTPVIIFTHSPPTCESKNFTNPNGTHTINKTDGFQNLIVEQLKDGAKTINDSAKIEMQEFADFLKLHQNIKAYFHGHDNANEFYTWTGPNHDVSLPTYRVDSPMKGNFSKADETKLSFQLISIDSVSQTMTVRECLWDPDSTNPNAPMAWGQTSTISLKVARPAKPSIQANGQSGLYAVPADQPVNLTASLQANNWNGKTAEHWIYVKTPAGGLFNGATQYYNGHSWTSSVVPYKTTAIADFAPVSVYNGSTLSAGIYTVYFFIDTLINGVIDNSTAVDSVKFSIGNTCLPSIAINGSTSDITVARGSQVEVTVSVDSKSWSGSAADYFIYYDGPDGTRHMYHNDPGYWTSGASYQGKTYSFSNFSVLKSSNLASGVYVFHVTMDNIQDGIMDGAQVTSSIRLTIQ